MSHKKPECCPKKKPEEARERANIAEFAESDRQYMSWLETFRATKPKFQQSAHKYLREFETSHATAAQNIQDYKLSKAKERQVPLAAFDFYVADVRSLLLNEESTFEGKVNASLWLKKLEEKKDTRLGRDYLVLMLMCLHTYRHLKGPLSEKPTEELTKYKNAKNLFEMWNQYSSDHYESAAVDSNAPISVAIDSSLKDYAACQESNNRINIYFATSPYSINEWTLPKGSHPPLPNIGKRKDWEKSFKLLGSEECSIFERETRNNYFEQAQGDQKPLENGECFDPNKLEKGETKDDYCKKKVVQKFEGELRKLTVDNVKEIKWAKDSTLTHSKRPIQNKEIANCLYCDINMIHQEVLAAPGHTLETEDEIIRVNINKEAVEEVPHNLTHYEQIPVDEDEIVPIENDIMKRCWVHQLVPGGVITEGECNYPTSDRFRDVKRAEKMFHKKFLPTLDEMKERYKNYGGKEKYEKSLVDMNNVPKDCTLEHMMQLRAEIARKKKELTHRENKLEQCIRTKSGPLVVHREHKGGPRYLMTSILDGDYPEEHQPCSMPTYEDSTRYMPNARHPGQPQD